MLNVLFDYKYMVYFRVNLVPTTVISKIVGDLFCSNKEMHYERHFLSFHNLLPGGLSITLTEI